TDATLVVTVTRSGNTTQAGSIRYVTVNGTATAGSDYTATDGTLSFAVGQTTATFNVPILADQTTEGNETFTLSLSNPTGGVALGSPATATVT
ncbi:hypothetical protein M3M33_13695, partial [Loigolactobacillus coryniformis]|uniref:Calx-beta domain-containing protein n=1 Tax=Loigolactobacillus coryniformis TaxID=1610 RepID=UPI00201AFBFC